MRYQGPILERAAETEALDRLMEEARAGVGGLVMLEGAAGLGKTTLVRHAIDRARQRGIRVLNATGSQLETGFPFGIARQLLERALDGALDAQRPGVLSDATVMASRVLDGESISEEGDTVGPAAVHSLFRVTLELASAQPLLIAVDDAHWSDVASLQFLHYLARRVGESPAGVLIAARPTDVASAPAALAALLSSDDATVLRPQLLSPVAVAELARRVLGTEPEPEFTGACRQVTGGNAFLVTELLRELALEGSEPSADVAAALEQLAPDAIRDRVSGWLVGLAEPVVAIARSLAVLGEAKLPLLARHAGVEIGHARAACLQLERIGVVEGATALRFEHPLIAMVVASTIRGGERSAAHRRAAELLREEDAPLDAQAVQLLATRPEADGWTASLLHEAAISALARGAPAEAAGYLRRALAEPPPEALRPTLLLELGRAQVRMGEYGEAQETLRRGIETSPEGEQRTILGTVMSKAYFLAGDTARALDALEQARRTEQDEVRLVALDGNAITLGLLDRERGPEMRARLAGYRDRAVAGQLREPILVALAGAQSVLQAEPYQAGVALVRRAFEAGLSAFHEHTFAFGWAICALDATDLSSEAIVHLDRALAEARPRMDAAITSYLLTYRTHLALRVGRLAEAEADGRAGLELVRLDNGASFPVALLEVLIERGAPEEAWELCQQADFKGSQQRSAMVELVAARVSVALGKGEEALPRLLSAGEQLDAMAFLQPQFAPWRAVAAPLADQLGQRGLALSLAAEGLELAERSGAPTSLSQALRIDGDLRRDLDALTRSAELARETRDLLELGRSLMSLGRAQAATGLQPEARANLRDAFATAHEAGALALADAARRELVSAGGRPRRAALRGVESLTPSELQVARLAGEALSNREIADALFVSLKMVEQHLARAYSKLEISGRRELVGALTREGNAGPGQAIDN